MVRRLSEIDLCDGYFYVDLLCRFLCGNWGKHGKMLDCSVQQKQSVTEIGRRKKRQNSTHNAEVEGSSPPLTTKIKHISFGEYRPSPCVVVSGSARLGSFWATLFNTWRRLAKKSRAKRPSRFFANARKARFAGLRLGVALRRRTNIRLTEARLMLTRVAICRLLMPPAKRY
jgi:hypothetical protein